MKYLVFIILFVIMQSFFIPFVKANDLDAMLLNDEALLLDSNALQFSLRGNYKNLLTFFHTDNFLDKSGASSEKSLIADVNRLRLSPEIKRGSNFILHADIDNEIIFANYVNSRTFNHYWHGSHYNDLFDASVDSDLSGDSFFRFNLHRCYAKLATGKMTLTIGRQQIRFGSGRLWNPLDILNPIEPTFVEGAENQKGTDAIRFEYYPGISTELAFVYAPKRIDDKFDFDTLANKNTNLITRFKTTLRDADIAILGGRVTRRYLTGIDIAAILFDGMLRGSILYAMPDHNDNYILASVGYEYNFANGIYALIEYFHNQNALNQNDSLSFAYAETLTNEMNEERYALLANQFLTLNRNYFGMLLGYDITPLLRGELFAIADIEGRGIFCAPALKYNLMQNLDISVTAMMGYIFDGASYPSDFKEFEDHPLFSAVLQWYF